MSEPVELKPGDVVMLGGYPCLIYRDVSGKLCNIILQNCEQGGIDGEADLTEAARSEGAPLFNLAKVFKELNLG